MKILITGGTVFVSRCLAEHFISKGHEVYLLNRGTHSQPQGSHLIKADRYNLGGALESFTFDAVIAVNTYDEKDMGLLLDALSGGSIFRRTWRFQKFIFISSSAVYPEVNRQPFTEDQSTGWNKIWADYGLNKAAAEKLLLHRVKNAYILRPPYFYGAGNNLYREAFAFDCARARRPFYIPADGSMTMQFYAVSDLCAFTEKLLAESPSHKIFNLGNPQSVTIKQWASQCYSAAGASEPQFVSVSAAVPQRSYFPFYAYQYALDVSREMAFCPPVVSLEEGLAASFKWYAAHEAEVSKKPYLDFIDKNLK